MISEFSRRRTLGVLGAFGAVVLGRVGRACELTADAKPDGPSPFAGIWTYRSLINNPDPKVAFNDLAFAVADLTIREAGFGEFAGRLSFDNDGLSLKGTITYGNPFTVRFQGNGDSAGTKGWIYNYQGYLAPAWPDGVDQRPAIIGTIVRTVAHGAGNPAGFVASFIAVKRDSAGK
jgi:hypothetical protein